MSDSLPSIALYYVGIPVDLSAEQRRFRALYDPKCNFNEAHATLVAPFAANLMTSELDAHFASVVAACTRMKIVAQGYHITDQGYIFYTFDRESVLLLKQIYARLHEHPVLKDHVATQVHNFMPHITIGKFESKISVPTSIHALLPELCRQRSMAFDCVRLYGILKEPNKQREIIKEYMPA